MRPAAGAAGAPGAREHLVGAVLGEDARVLPAGAPRPAGGDHFALVALRRTEVLLPLAPRAASGALRRRSAFTGGSALLATASAASPPGIRALLARAPRVVAPHGWPLREWLCGQLGRHDLTIAAGLGTPRPNAKPVVLVLGPDGALLAVAKLATGPATEALIADEADALATISGWSLPATVPEPLGAARVGGRAVVLQRALDTWSWAPPPRRLPLELIVALSGVGRRALHLADAPYVAGLQRRLDAAGIAPGDRPRFPDPGGPLAFGPWHGDLTPWNVAWVRGRLAVWDWERFGREVPVGFDVLHYAFHAHRARHARRPPGGDAAALAHARGELAAARIVDPRHIDTISTMYLAEMLARFGDPAVDAAHRGLAHGFAALLAA